MGLSSSRALALNNPEKGANLQNLHKLMPKLIQFEKYRDKNNKENRAHTVGLESKHKLRTVP